AGGARRRGAECTRSAARGRRGARRRLRPPLGGRLRPRAARRGRRVALPAPLPELRARADGEGRRRGDGALDGGGGTHVRMRTILVALLAGIALVAASPVAAATEVHLISPADGTTLGAGESLVAQFTTDFERNIFPAAVRLDVARDFEFTDLVDREEVG